MTVIIDKKLYCKKCKEYFEVPVLMSTNSFLIERDPELKRRVQEGTLFKNFCPKCNSEMIIKEEE